MDNLEIDIIRKAHPDLFDFIDGDDMPHLYFKDKNISRDAFYINNVRKQKAMGSWVNGIRIASYDTISMYIQGYSVDEQRTMWMELNFRVDGYISDGGCLIMSEDYKLSDCTCVGLYEMGIDVFYRDDKSPKKRYINGLFLSYESYDKDVIMRRHAIKNIIEHG